MKTAFNRQKILVLMQSMFLIGKMVRKKRKKFLNMFLGERENDREGGIERERERDRENKFLNMFQVKKKSKKQATPKTIKILMTQTTDGEHTHTFFLSLSVFLCVCLSFCVCVSLFLCRLFSYCLPSLYLSFFYISLSL